MTSISSSTEDNFKPSKLLTQRNIAGDSSLNHALIAVAQEVAARLQQAYLVQADNIDRRKIAIHANEPEDRQSVSTKPLTERELEVLQLITEGHSHAAIARKLSITVGTVKAHVRNLLKKL